MLVELTYWLLAASTLFYTTVYGGRDGQWLATAYLSGIILTKFAHAADRNWDHFHPIAFTIDVALFAALVLISLKSQRYWPLWIAGLQLAAVSSHLGALLVPVFAERVYFVLQSLWSLPQLIILVFGVSLDRKRGQ